MNLEQANQEIVNIVKEVVTQMDLSQTIKFNVLTTDKSKKIVKFIKVNKVTEKVSDKDNLIVVVINDKAFERLDDDTKYELVRMSLEPISYDFEKDKINTKTPMIEIPLSYYQKHGDKASKLAELEIYTMQQIEDEEEQKKLEEKLRKKSKRKK
jgi:hypothetical protein